MTIKSSGNSLSFSEIEAEFGGNGTRSLGGYRVSQSVGSLSNLPLDTGIPKNGTIKFSNFYGKRLNIPSGTAARFEPGQSKDVELIEIKGLKKIFGFNKKIMGNL